jgi:hypothetical protein
MKTFLECLWLNSSQSPSNTNMARLDDYTNSAQEDANENDDNNNGNKTFESRIHEIEVIEPQWIVRQPFAQDQKA